MGKILLAAALALLFVATPTAAQTPLPKPTGFVSDTAGALSPEMRHKLELLITELQQKTGAEIAVVIVNTTAPLDDFNYAMKIADEWKPGRKKDDTGIVVLLALKDRKLRILTGYGVEGILPDGLVGEIQDRQMIPALRSGDVDAAVWNGVTELARRIAADRGVTLTGLPERRAPQQQQPLSQGAVLVLLVIGIILMMYIGPRMGLRGGPPIFFPGGGRRGGGGGFHGGFGGGNGGFGGFGGGGFGGGGAGRSW